MTRDRTVAYVVIEHDDSPDFSWLEQDCYDPSSPEYDAMYPSREAMERGDAPFDPHYYRNPVNHVALQMIAYGACDHEDCRSERCAAERVVDSLGNIDFLRDSDEWTTGRFCKLSQLARFPYLRELAAEMGLK